MNETIDAPVIDTPVTPVAPVPDDASLADHEAAFGRTKAEPSDDADDDAKPDRARDPKSGQFSDKPRHRAQSQKARAEDVPRIQELTKRHREAEARAEAAEARAAALEAKQKPEAPAAFTDAEPTIEQFANEPDPYAAWTRALAKYDRKKETHEERAQSAEVAAKARETQARDAEATRAKTEQNGYQGKLETFVSEHPDFGTLLSKWGDENGTDIPPALVAAFWRLDNGPEVVYSLLQNPLVFDEMILLADGKPVTDAHVATLQRLLTSKTRAQAARTGSVAAITHSLAPRPPNPVRTGPMRSSDTPPTDESSLADHEKFYGARR